MIKIKEEIIAFLLDDFGDYLKEFAVDIVADGTMFTAIVTTQKGKTFTASDKIADRLLLAIWKEVAMAWIADPASDHGTVTEKPTPRYTGHAENFKRPKAISDREAEIRHKLAFGVK